MRTIQWLALSAATICTPLSAQVNTATILGRVSDATGAVIPNAKVTARNLDTGLERTVMSDEAGAYEVALLSIGSYRLTVEMQGLATEVRQGITLAAGDRLRLDVALSPGQVSESVTVSGTATLVNTTSPELGTVIDSQKVQGLPIANRNFTTLVTLQPGVQASNVGGRNSFNLNGQTQWGLNLTMDGTDASFIESPSFGDPSGRSVLNTVSVDSIAEFRVLSGTFSAETGRASAGAVNIITKGGTNNFHGTLFHYLRNRNLDARVPNSISRDPLVQNQFGGNLGGPILQNKLFFFGSFERASRRVGQQITANVFTDALRNRTPAVFAPFLAAMPAPTEPTANPDIGLHRRSDQLKTDENLGNGRLDWNTEKMVTSVRYSINSSANSIPYLFQTNRQVFDITNHVATVSNTYTVSPRMLNELRLGFNRWFIPRLNSTYFGGFGEVIVSGLYTATNFEGLLRFATNSFTLADNFSVRAGRHSIKMGFEIRNVRAGRIQRQNPVYTFNNVNDFLANRLNNVRVIFGTIGTEQRQLQNGFFVQDDIQVSSRLTLNLGLRYEYYTVIQEREGRLFNVKSDPFGPFSGRGESTYAPDRNNFNPRLGLAWDVSGNQKTIVRAGGGIYSSPIIPYFIFDTATIDPRLPFATNATPGDIPGLAFPISGALKQAVDNPNDAVSLGLAPSVVGRRIVDPRMRDNYSMMWNLTVQRQLSKNMVLQLGYIGNNNVKAQNSRTLNLIDPVLRRRPDPTIGEILYVESSGRRNYNAFQMELRGRRMKGLTSDVFYTYSKSLTYGGDDCCTGNNPDVMDFDNVAASRAVANTDIRHQLTWALGYDLPGRDLWKGSFANKLVSGWSIQNITRIRSGRPINITSGTDVRGNGFAGSQRPNYVGGDIYAANRSANLWLNRAAFAAPPAGQYGNLGRNVARGPSAFQFDVSFLKNTALWREHNLQFRAEIFNLPNTPIWENPVSAINNPNFGRILTGIAASQRQVQLSLRYQF
ncbi:MAG: carboxypeptidase regulatory-like domain-containing protein [Bryobacteraceae bacterium]|nr:carboxypeptidase regulatory-like domain-containing protein [Bryobacteraceae bacterium]